MNRWASDVLAAIESNPDGLDYAGLCRLTGLARDRIAKHVQTVVQTGLVKAYVINGELLYKPTKLAKIDPIPEPAKASAGLLDTATPPTVPSSARVVRPLDEPREPAMRVAPIEIPQFIKEAVTMGDRPPLPPSEKLQALTLENVITAAAHLAAAVEDAVDLDDEGSADLARAVRGFKLAERIHELAKAD